MTDLYVRRDAFTRVTCLTTRVCDMTFLLCYTLSYHTYEHAIVHMRTNESCRTLIQMCDLTCHVAEKTWHDWFICVTWLIDMCDASWSVRMCDMVCSCMWHDAGITTHSHVRYDSCGCVQHDAFTCVTWLSTHATWRFHVYDAPYLHVNKASLFYALHDSFVCVTWHIYVCDMTFSNVWYDSCKCVAFLVYAWNTQFTHAMCLIHEASRPKNTRVHTHKLTYVWIWGGYDE